MCENRKNQIYSTNFPLNCDDDDDYWFCLLSPIHSKSSSILNNASRLYFDLSFLGWLIYFVCFHSEFCVSSSLHEIVNLIDTECLFLFILYDVIFDDFVLLILTLSAQLC